MKRETIHPDYPFTADEHVVAWVLVGDSVRKALVDLEYLRADLDSDEMNDADESGWIVRPRVHLMGQFLPAIHLAAHVLSGGSFLSDQAREAWLSAWTTRVSESEAEARLLELNELGATVTAHNGVFRRLLTTGLLQ